MSTIAKVLIAVVLVIGVGGGVAVAQASGGSDDPVGEVRGPCDEAEHAGDPRCAGGVAQPPQDRAEANDDRQRRKRHRGANRGRSGHSGHSGSSHSGRSGPG
jgi:hypothetical protein